MFKLVCIGGKLRGKEFNLEEGENSFGRSPECTHALDVAGISKKHMSMQANQDSVFVEDLGSSNGTFVNNKIIKKKTITDGDRIALPNLIFQLVYVKEKKKIIKKTVLKATENHKEVDFNKEIMPKSFVKKIGYFFRQKIMPIVYGFNEQYEWRVLVAILMFIYIAINIYLTLLPVMTSYKGLLVRETINRGIQYANEVVRTNTAALSRKDLDQLNTSFLEKASMTGESGVEGVESYELIDLEGRIVRPATKMNTYTDDPGTVAARAFYQDDSKISSAFFKKFGDDIVIAQPLRSYDMASGREEVIGVIAIRFRPQSIAIQASQNSVAYLEALITSFIVGIIFFFLIYYLTQRHITELNFQIEESLRGKRKDLESDLLMDEIAPLRSTVNSLIQRVRESQNDGDDSFAELEEDGTYVRNLYEFMQGSLGPTLVLDSEKSIQHLNGECEDLIGMRESSAAGTSLLDSLRDQGLAATIIDLCDQSANNEGTNQNEIYEVGGDDHFVHVSSLMGKDNFAKAFYITFVKDQ